MAMRSGFFDSDIVGYYDDGMPQFDRAEDAEFYSRFWGSLVGNGVLSNPANSFKVLADSGLTLAVQAGICWIEGRFAFNEEVERITLPAADGLRNRIDRIVLRLDLQTRDISVQIKKGTPAASPQSPALSRPVAGESADVYELGIADVLVEKNSVTVTQAQITDLRLSSQYCGVVTGLIKQADTTAVFQQYETYLNQRMAYWNATQAQQSKDWSTQFTQQKSDFDGWFSGIKANIETLKTFDFDNISELKGCNRSTTFSTAGDVITERIYVIASNKTVATRVTAFLANGNIKATVTVYKDDGTTVHKQSTTTTVFNVDGSVSEGVV